MSGVDTVFLVHHTHHDIGYTHDQPVVWDLYRRFMDAALDLCQQDAERQGDDCFRWTVETTLPLLHWLETAPPARRRLLRDLCQLGRIEITAMPLNITPLYDTAQLVEALEPLRLVRQELGATVRHAMNSDVNGQNWPLVDALLDAGIEAFSMAINVHFGGAPPGRPSAFRWVGPSGREILAWNGWSYGYARRVGLGQSAARFAEWWPRLAAHLAGTGSPLTAVMLQIMTGDNGPPDPDLPGFIRAWNASGQKPRLVLAVPANWWARVVPCRDALPVWRGDWTDFWNFGAGSSARETAINRASRGRLYTADLAAAAMQAFGGELGAQRAAPAPTRARAVSALNLWDEHTWGANCSVRDPDNEDTAAQWYHKAACAYTARSLTLMLQRDAAAELARRVRRKTDDALLVFNPCAHARIVAGPVHNVEPAAQRGRADDPSAARHFQDRRTGAAWAYLPPTEVPGYGYAVVPRAALRPAGQVTSGDQATVECGRHRLTFDLRTGGVRSWYDREVARELVDATCPWPLNGFVHEQPGGDPPRREAMWSARQPWRGGPLELERDWHPGWVGCRRGPTSVRSHRVLHTPTGVQVTQVLDAPGVSGLVQTVTLVDGMDRVEFESSWRMSDQTAPEATYLVFPFALAEARVRLDLGGQALEPELDQLPGTCRDYFTVQRWVDFAGVGGGATIACPDTPLVQLGSFSFAADRAAFRLGAPWLLAWVTNNYWDTNFRASQPGAVRARFAVRAYSGPFQEAAAHRFGAETALPAVIGHLGEPPVGGALLPARASLLRLPESPVLVLALRPDPADGSVLLRLLNASDAVAKAVVAPGALGIARAAGCDLLGSAGEALATDREGAVRLVLGPRRMAALRLWLTVRG